MKYLIDEKLVNAILTYLANKPYIEVANLIQGMNGMMVYEEPQPEAETSSVKSVVKNDTKSDSPKV